MEEPTIKVNNGGLVISLDLRACLEAGLLCYRSNEGHILYKVTKFTKRLAVQVCLMDGFLHENAGHHIMQLEDIKKEAFMNVRSNSFLRPYSAILRAGEGLKVKRIKAGMLTMAKEGAYYYLWWHPHNWGRNTDENLAMLDHLLQYYEKYNFQSYSMQEVAMLWRQ